jgi:carboxypeptidase Q
LLNSITMKRIILFSSALILSIGFFLSSKNEEHYKYSHKDSDSAVVSKMYKECLMYGEAYENLRGLCLTAPKRLSGSPGAQKAVEYMESVMKKSGFDKVWLQPCMVPHWERGKPETAEITYYNDKSKTGEQKKMRVNVCALGGSVATPENGLMGNLIEVSSFDELAKLGRKNIEGKIVFYNHKFDDSKISVFHAYGEAVQYRWMGPRKAQDLGAIGVLVRSVTSSIDTFPHTGSARRDSLAATIPAAAVSTKDAEEIHKLLDDKTMTVGLTLKMNCKWLEDVKSYNVIGEITGSEFPNEVICVGGHLDAWDLGDGAHDDGAGCVQGIEAVRLFKALGIRPKRTIRAVCWMNEENGGRGGEAYADSALARKEKHIAAIESDAGGFTPRGFGFDMPAAQKTKIKSWQPLFVPYGSGDFEQGGGGSDIEPLQKQGTPLIGLEPDGARYFDYHHTEDDVFKNVNRRELHLGAASMASLIYLIDKYGL